MRGPNRSFDGWLKEESNELLSMILPFMNLTTEDLFREEIRRYLMRRRHDENIKWLHHIVLCHKVLYCFVIGDLANAIKYYEMSNHYPASPTTRVSLEVDILDFAEKAGRVDVANKIRRKFLDHVVCAFRWSIDQKCEREPLTILKDSFRSLSEYEFDTFVGRNKLYIDRYLSTVDFFNTLSNPPWNSPDVARAVQASLEKRGHQR